MTNKEFNDTFRDRTKRFAVHIIKFIETIPFNSATKIMVYQLGRAGTSVGANFRAFCRGRSKNERFAKICIVVEEADESQYWLELFFETNYGDKKELTVLLKEANELTKVMTKIKDSTFPQ